MPQLSVESSLSTQSTLKRRRKPGHIIPNSIVRIQAEQQFKQCRKESLITQQSKISKFAKLLPESRNTMIYGPLLSSESYQAHLERIADFMVVGEGIWWHKDMESEAIVFHDSERELAWRPEGPHLSHFRSSTLNSVTEQVSDLWQKCLSTHVALPIEKVKVFTADGEFDSYKYFNLFDNEVLEPSTEEVVPQPPDIDISAEEPQPEVQISSLTLIPESSYELVEESDSEDGELIQVFIFTLSTYTF